MAISHGIQFVSGSSILLPSEKTAVVAVIGTATIGTNNQLKLITNQQEATTLFGNDNASTLPRTLEVLLRYGVNQIVALKVATTADADILGGVDGVTGLRTGMELLQDSWSQLGVQPRFLLVPGVNSNAVITKAVQFKEIIGALPVFNFAPGDSLTAVQTARGGNTGLGLKSDFLACYPHLKRASDPSIIESIAANLVGIMATMGSYGRSPSNRLFKGVAGADVPLLMSYSNEAADTETLNRLGVITVNRRDDGFVSWGNRTAAFTIGGNTGLETYIVSSRIKDVVKRGLRGIGSKFIDAPSNYNTVNLIKEAYQRYLSQEAAKGELGVNNESHFIAAESDFTKGILTFKTEVEVLLPLEIVRIQTIQTTVNVGSV